MPTSYSCFISTPSFSPFPCSCPFLCNPSPLFLDSAHPSVPEILSSLFFFPPSLSSSNFTFIEVIYFDSRYDLLSEMKAGSFNTMEIRSCNLLEDAEHTYSVGDCITGWTCWVSHQARGPGWCCALANEHGPWDQEKYRERSDSYRACLRPGKQWCPIQVSLHPRIRKDSGMPSCLSNIW